MAARPHFKALFKPLYALFDAVDTKLAALGTAVLATLTAAGSLTAAQFAVAGGSVITNVASGNVLTLPKDLANVIGKSVFITQQGAGATTITPATGVTINGGTAGIALTRNATGRLVCVAANTYLLSIAAPPA